MKEVKVVLREPKSLEIIQNSIRHIEYELNQFVAIIRFFKFCRVIPKLVNNSFIDSFVMHTRNILFFLTSSSTRPDDIVADDFFHPGFWFDNKKLMSDFLDSEYRKIHKLGAHLTYSRITYAENQNTDWVFQKINDEVADLFNNFVDEYSKNGIFNQILVPPLLDKYEKLEFVDINQTTVKVKVLQM